MDNLWLWLLGIFAVIIIAAMIIPRSRTQASVDKKPEIKRAEPKEEFGEEFHPIASVQEPKRREEAEPDLFIPHYYGIDRLVVAAKDPNWLYVYWEISDHLREEFIQRYGEASWTHSRPVLRVYDLTGLEVGAQISCHSYRDVYIDPFADNWFVEVGQANRCFVVELGRLLADGSYVALLTSDMVTTPRNTLSHRVDEEWMWIEGIHQGLGGTCGSSEILAGKNLGFSSPSYQQ